MIRHAYQLMMRPILAKRASGELTEEEFKQAFAECVQAAREHGVLPDCFEARA